MSAFIDTDVLVYSSAFAAQKNLYHVQHESFDGGVKTFTAHKDFVTWAKLNELDYKVMQVAGKVDKELQVLPENVALAIAKQKLDRICEAVGTTAKEAQLLLTGTGNFRDIVAVTKPYKGNRTDVEKPVHFNLVRSYYHSLKNCEVVNGIEADDAMGILQTDSKNTGIICTIDKDLNQLPGKHYNWDDGSKYRVSEEDAHLYFMAQAMAGDSTDNIPGIPGTGMAGALKNLRKVVERDTRFHLLTTAYADAKEADKFATNWQEYLDEQGRLVWIMRKPDEVWTADYYWSNYVEPRV